MKASLLDLAPQKPQYRALRKVLAGYRETAAEGGWPELPSTLQSKPGQKSSHVRMLAHRLARSGDYTGRVSPGDGVTAFDADLLEAVKRFQRRHGLVEDGVVGPATVVELNVPIQHRIGQIELNLERWRWVPRDLGERHILVNIPEFRMEVWDGGRVPVSMRVVVGTRDEPTPIFHEKMTYLVFSPYWNIPPGIARSQTLPAVIADPRFLDRHNMEVLDASRTVIDPAAMDLDDPTQYFFRQRLGAQNSLGLVKFMFPNQHHVYLHDTPADALFERVSRSFSHGCVRVEEPVALAEYLLRDQPEWGRGQIEDAMAAGEERTVKLQEPIPVYLGYWTVGVSAGGETEFRRDIYGIDRKQASLLADRISRLRTAAEAAARAAGNTASDAASGPSSADTGH